MPKGCPRRAFSEVTKDGERIIRKEGCPWWIAREVEVTLKTGEKQIETMSQCYDFWMHDDRQYTNKRLNGLQTVSEDMRNGLTQEVNGKTLPRPDPGTVALYKLIKDTQRTCDAQEKKENGKLAGRSEAVLQITNEE
jgi:hypothetical protein